MIGFFLFFDLGLVFPCYCLWLRFVVFRLWWFCFCVFDLGLVFPFYCLWFKSVWFRLWWIFLVFEVGIIFWFYCLWFKSVGFRVWWILFFLNCSFFFHFIDFGLSRSGLGYDGFLMVFFDLGLLLQFYCLSFKSVGFRLWWIFFFNF